MLQIEVMMFAVVRQETWKEYGSNSYDDKEEASGGKNVSAGVVLMIDMVDSWHGGERGRGIRFWSF